MVAVEKKINGIDTEAVKQLAGAIAAHPDSGIAGFRVRTVWKGGTRSETRVDEWTLGGQELARGFTIASDEPAELAGGGSAPNPQEILMAGLNACMMVGYVALCALEGIELEQLEIETDGELDLRGFLAVGGVGAIPAGYPEVNYRVRIRGGGSPEQFQRIHETVQATSPNYFNVTQPIRLNAQLVLD